MDQTLSGRWLRPWRASERMEGSWRPGPARGPRPLRRQLEGGRGVPVLSQPSQGTHGLSGTFPRGAKPWPRCLFNSVQTPKSIRKRKSEESWASFSHAPPSALHCGQRRRIRTFIESLAAANAGRNAQDGDLLQEKFSLLAAQGPAGLPWGLSRAFPGTSSFYSSWNVWEAKASVPGPLGWGASRGPSQLSLLEEETHQHLGAVLTGLRAEAAGWEGLSIRSGGGQGRAKSVSLDS